MMNSLPNEPQESIETPSEPTGKNEPGREPSTSEKKQSTTWIKQPAAIISLVMVLLALFLLADWLMSGSKPARTEPTLTPSATAPLTAPVVQVEPQDPATSAPTPTPLETRVVPTPTATVVPRTEVITYTLAEGDSISSVAEKFGLWPESIIWANRYELGDDLNLYTPGRQIYILPVDGVYHVWTQGESLRAVAEFYGVTTDDIIDNPANHLDRATLGGLTSPNIPAGTHLVVPGGTIPNYFADSSLLSYPAVSLLRSLPLGTPEDFPAPRDRVVAYEVQPGESIFGIAEKFGLKAETVLWANRYIIGDTPDGVYAGQKLIILPSDGVFHAWSYGEGLNGVARNYQVSVDAILDEPSNHLETASLGDYSLPRIKTGTFLFIPGAVGSTPSWVTPVGPGEDGIGSHPNVSYLGAFACNATANQMGTGFWQLPTGRTGISGYEYNPPVHNGLDYDGETGDALYATDSGVVIYAGLSDRGYGNTIVIDHGNGYLSLYGHLMDGGVAVGCGQVVYSGSVIGYMGSTGNSTGSHLHFEIRYNGSPVNPHGFGL